MNVIPQIMEEVMGVMTQVNESSLGEAMKYLTKEQRIFVYGEGRSGFQGKGLAMRLMHIGYEVYVVGETITPSIQGSDILISISGSGTTKNIVDASVKAKKIGTKVIAFSISDQNPLADIADLTIIVPGSSKNGEGVASIQLLSTLFDQSVHLTMDALCLLVSRRDQIGNQEANRAHSNME